MSLSFCVLGSGSSGNCTVLICEGDGQRRCLLIDAGLSPRATARRLKPLGVRLHDLSAILLTHLDFDHFHAGWLRAIERLGLNLRIHIHRRHRSAAWEAGLSMRCAEIFHDAIDLDDCVRVAGVLLSHDDLGSIGFVLEHAELRLGYATDLGRVPAAFFDHFAGLDALAIESNYDRQMQIDSARPAFLKRRIMNGNGHLSNEQALEAVQRIDDGSRLTHVALLHLSRKCNDPDLVRTLYARHAPHLLDRLTITHQYRPSSLLRIDGAARHGRRTMTPASRQMFLFDSLAAPQAISAV